MKRPPMFTPNGDGYDITLAGVLLLAGDAVHGDPAETAPQGRANAQEMVDCILAAATAGGFRMADTVRALLRRNEPTARLQNLAQNAVLFIAPPLQSHIIREFNARASSNPGTKEPPQ
jgi:hypothetical protein